MKIKAKLIILAAIGAMFLFAAKYSNAMHHEEHAAQQEQNMDAHTSHAAPDFTLKAATGETVSLSDFKGKAVVLEWTNFGCPYVRKHYDSGNMQNLQKKYTEAGVIWLSINSSAKGKQGHFEGGELREKISENNNHATYYLNDTTGDVGHLFDAKTTPHMFVIDEEGNVIYHGAIDNVPSADKADIDGATNYVAAALDAHLNGEDVKVKTTQPYGCGVKYE